MIKDFFNRIWDYCIVIGTARAATAMARNGHWREARDLYVDDRRA